MNIEITAKHGDRCSKEVHQFRIGVDTRESTEFSAGRDKFRNALIDALIDHGNAKRRGHLERLSIQVFCGPGAKWRNIQNPKTGGVIAIGRGIPDQSSADKLFMWACNSIQMARDIDVMASGMAREATE